MSKKKKTKNKPKPSGPEEVLMVCPTCFRVEFVTHLDNEPEGTMRIFFQCPPCLSGPNGAGLAPVYFDKDGNELAPKGTP